MSETIYPGGIRLFDPREGAPDFVVGTLIIEPNELVAWLKAEGNAHLKEYQGRKQLKCQILKGNKGLYAKVDTFEPKPQSEPPAFQPSAPPPATNASDDGLPF